MNLSDLPAINACLNSLSAVFLALGYWFIRRNNRIAHRNCMVAAVFLVCYLVYHYFAGRTVFQNPPWFRPVYLGILLTHTVLAVAVVPLVLTTLWRAVKTDLKGHRKIARWTWPIWMYVSVTGVVIYLLLYQVFPQS